MSAYYNENDPKAAAWLRELIKEGHIAPGYVDERSICDVRAHELTSYVQQHFFAGIGGWSCALRLAGWPDSRPVRTASCPCQPFSVAGLGRGEEDERHLWPVCRDLITFGAPTATFGEQVASAAGRLWLARIRADLEGLGYAVGAADLCSAGVGSPHIRQRLWWVAYPNGGKPGDRRIQRGREHGQQPQDGGSGRRMADSKILGPARGHGKASAGSALQPERQGSVGGLAHSFSERGRGRPARRADAAHARQPGEARRERERERERETPVVWLGHPNNSGPQGRKQREHGADKRTFGPASLGRWADYALCECADGKARRVEPGTFPLAHGVSGRVGLLRGYGNAINPVLAAEFIQACEEARSMT